MWRAFTYRVTAVQLCHLLPVVLARPVDSHAADPRLPCSLDHIVDPFRVPISILLDVAAFDVRDRRVSMRQEIDKYAKVCAQSRKGDSPVGVEHGHGCRSSICCGLLRPHWAGVLPQMALMCAHV